MPPLQFLIKPASSGCNMRCKYCFYFSEAEQRSVANYGMMNQSTLETLVRKGLSYAEGSCGFAFQGGEPTLVGLPYFKKLIEYVRRYNDKGLRISYSIQTNGTPIDDDWARFFHENKFLVGLSLDGNSTGHNMHRIDARGAGTFNTVMKTARLLEQHRVEFNILTVVTGHTARHARRTYEFFKKSGFRYLQFIHCLDPLGEEPGQYPFSLKPAALEGFLKQLFDYWYDDFTNGNYISIRYFDNLVQMLMGHRPEACNMNGVCSCNCVVEADGGLYPCDFYMLDEWRLGNILTDELPDMLHSERAQAFVQTSVEPDAACLQCKWRTLCRGGCRRERELGPDIGLGLNRFCSAYHGFFDYAGDRLLQVARQVSRNR